MQKNKTKKTDSSTKSLKKQLLRSNPHGAAALIVYTNLLSPKCHVPALLTTTMSTLIWIAKKKE